MPLTLGELNERIKRCMEGEDIKDDWFRVLLAVTEVGDIVKYITHDSVLNPGARPHGTKEDEALAYGQALVQTIAALQLRKIDLVQALEFGLRNWEDRDWRKCTAQQKSADILTGIGVVAGNVRGRVYISSVKRPLSAIPAGSILVAPFIKPELVEFMDRIVALITDHGGGLSHAANIARGKNVISIVGTGNATKILEHGQEISINIPTIGHDTKASITRF